jgi:hypothetical protein
MTELTNKLGTYTEWNEMNVLQQQSYAEALGMSKEMVDEIYKKQELATALGAQAGANLQTQYATLEKQGKSHQQIVALMGQQAASDALSASASERMQATMERVNDTIGKMAQAFMPVIEKVAALAEKFASFVGSGDNLRNILIGVSGVLGGLLTTSIALGAQKRANLLLDKQAHIEAIRENTAAANTLAYSVAQKNAETIGLGVKKAGNIAEK